MTIDYETFKPHPTVYKGIRFRSRLEATWAAFFDKLEWQWEYEPFDLGRWSPDFLIKGTTRDALVEVKPISKFDEGIADKIKRASTKDYDLYAGDYNLFLCGLSPVIEKQHLALLHSCCCCNLSHCYWGERFIVKIDGKFDVVFGHDPYTGFVTGLNGEKYGGPHDVDWIVGSEILELWAKAKNLVQWRP